MRMEIGDVARSARPAAPALTAFDTILDERFRSGESAWRNVIVSLATLMMLLSTTAFAQDLYGPEAPRDVAYLRFLNARPGATLTLQAPGISLPPLSFAEISSYHPHSPGTTDLSLAGEQVALDAAPESFHTLVALPERVLLLEDTPLRDISRGLLTLYNLTEGEVITLRTADGAAVLSDVEPGSADSLTIAEAEVGLTVHGEEGLLASLEPRLFQRGEAHSLIVMPLGSQPALIYDRARAAP